MSLLRTRDAASVVFHVRVGSGNDHDRVGFALPSDHVGRGPVLAMYLDDLARADRFVKMPGPDDQPIAYNSLHLRHPLRGIAIVHRLAGHGNWSLVARGRGQPPGWFPTPGAQWNAWGSACSIMIESFWSTMRELLDPQRWHTQQQLASATFEWIEALYNPARRHTSFGHHSPVKYEAFTPPPT
jgi:integrase-like protein